jgi:hypothetical protein
VRALLIANPFATSTTAVRREVITRALASELDLNVVQTRYRGHARHVAEGAARDGYELVLTLAEDGTVNEVGVQRDPLPGPRLPPARRRAVSRHAARCHGAGRRCSAVCPPAGW